MSIRMISDKNDFKKKLEAKGVKWNQLKDKDCWYSSYDKCWKFRAEYEQA